MQDIIQNIINSYSNSTVNSVKIITVLLMVLLFSILLFLVYRLVSHRSFYNKSFNITIALIPFFIATIILALQSNIIITLGTIGALAIIRFRTSIKDPIDMVYLLWSVYIGVMCGCQLFEVCLLTNLLVAFVLFVLENFNFGKKPYVLILHSDEDAENTLTENFKSLSISHKFKSRNYTNSGYDYAIEFSYNKLEDLKKYLEHNKSISKYSIICYDADDIV